MANKTKTKRKREREPTPTPRKTPARTQRKPQQTDRKTLAPTLSTTDQIPTVFHYSAWVNRDTSRNADARNILAGIDSIHDFNDPGGRVKQWKPTNELLQTSLQSLLTNPTFSVQPDSNEYYTKWLASITQKEVSSVSMVEDQTVVYYEKRFSAELNTHETGVLTYRKVLNLIDRLRKTEGMAVNDAIYEAGNQLHGDYSQTGILDIDMEPTENWDVHYSPEEKTHIGLFFLNYFFPPPNSDSAYNTSIPAYMTFDAMSNIPSKIFGLLDQVVNLVTPLNIADSATTGETHLAVDKSQKRAKVKNKYEFPVNDATQTKFLYTSPLYTADTTSWSIRKPSGGAEYTEQTRFPFTLDIEIRGRTPSHTERVVFDNEHSHGPSVSYLSRLIDGRNAYPENKMVDLESLAGAFRADGQMAVFLDMKRSGDWEQCNAAYVLNKGSESHSKGRVILCTIDRLCALYSRCIGQNALLHYGTHLKLYRFPGKDLTPDEIRQIQEKKREQLQRVLEKYRTVVEAIRIRLRESILPHIRNILADVKMGDDSRQISIPRIFKRKRQNVVNRWLTAVAIAQLERLQLDIERLDDTYREIEEVAQAQQFFAELSAIYGQCITLYNYVPALDKMDRFQSLENVAFFHYNPYLLKTLSGIFTTILQFDPAKRVSRSFSSENMYDVLRAKGFFGSLEVIRDTTRIPVNAKSTGGDQSNPARLNQPPETTAVGKTIDEGVALAMHTLVPATVSADISGDEKREETPYWKEMDESGEEPVFKKRKPSSLPHPSEESTEKSTKFNPSTIGKAIDEGVALATHTLVPATVSSDISGETSGDEEKDETSYWKEVPEEVPEEVSEEVSEEVPEEVPEEVSEEIPGEPVVPVEPPVPVEPLVEPVVPEEPPVPVDPTAFDLTSLAEIEYIPEENMTLSNTRYFLTLQARIKEQMSRVVGGNLSDTLDHGAPSKILGGNLDESFVKNITDNLLNTLSEEFVSMSASFGEIAETYYRSRAVSSSPENSTDSEENTWQIREIVEFPLSEADKHNIEMVVHDFLENTHTAFEEAIEQLDSTPSTLETPEWIRLRQNYVSVYLFFSSLFSEIPSLCEDMEISQDTLEPFLYRIVSGDNTSDQQNDYLWHNFLYKGLLGPHSAYAEFLGSRIPPSESNWKIREFVKFSWKLRLRSVNQEDRLTPRQDSHSIALSVFVFFQNYFKYVILEKTQRASGDASTDASDYGYYPGFLRGFRSANDAKTFLQILRVVSSGDGLAYQTVDQSTWEFDQFRFLYAQFPRIVFHLLVFIYDSEKSPRLIRAIQKLANHPTLMNTRKRRRIEGGNIHRRTNPRIRRLYPRQKTSRRRVPRPHSRARLPNP